MDKPLRRRLQPQVRKLEIIEAAERLLQAHGPRVRVEDVVREAGVAKGTFFLYFPTWDDLLDTLRRRLVSEFDTTYPLPTEVDGPVDWPSVVEAPGRRLHRLRQLTPRHRPGPVPHGLRRAAAPGRQRHP